MLKRGRILDLCPREESHALAITRFSEPSVLNNLRHGEPVAVPRPPPLFDSSLNAIRILQNTPSKGCVLQYWCPREESNLYYEIRNLASYPLNDKGYTALRSPVPRSAGLGLYCFVAILSARPVIFKSRTNR